MRNLPRLLVLFALSLLPSLAAAQVAYFATSTNQLLRIDLQSPGVVQRPMTITGLAVMEILLGLDFRPATGQLYGLGSQSHLYVINTWTGAATAVGSAGAFTLSGGRYGFSFNPTVDRIRVVSDAEQNLRLNPDTGALAGTDVALAYAAGDPNAGGGPNVVASAYTNTRAGSTATTLYGIDTGLNILVTQNPPNNGTLNTVGPLGFDVELVPGFDVRTAAGVNTAYAVLRTGGNYGLYDINLNTGAATILASLGTSPVITGFAVAPAQFKPPQDLNGDNRSDILYRNSSTGQVYRMLMDGFGVSFAGIVYTEPNLAWKIVADADFGGGTGGGTVDLLWRNSSNGQVYYMPFGTNGLPGAGGGVVHTEPDMNWDIVQTPDLNGDGKADLVWYNAATGQVYGMLLDGGAIIGQGLIHTEPNLAWSIVGTLGPVGGGRRNQLVWRNSSTGQVYLMTVTYSGSSFSQAGFILYTEPNTAWQIVGTPDLDGDGNADLLWRNTSTGQVYGMLVNGSTITTQGVIHTEPNMAWKIVATGDYDGDGKSDLLWRNESTGLLYMMRMNGLAIAAQQAVYQEPNTAWKVLGPYEYAQ